MNHIACFCVSDNVSHEIHRSVQTWLLLKLVVCFVLSLRLLTNHATTNWFVFVTNLLIVISGSTVKKI